MNRIFWRSKEGAHPPNGAHFFLQPFIGDLTPLSGQIITSLPSPSDPLTFKKRIDQPTRGQWRQMVEKALEQIEKNVLQKVVLARKTTFFLSTAPDPFRIAAALEKKAQGASLFCIELDSSAFLGASPERLFRRQEQNLFVDVLAGTAKQGKTLSEKDFREFKFVEEYFKEFQFTPPSIHKTANLEHFYSRGTALLQQNISDHDLVKALHPTPALCGTPKQTALDWIESEEPFRRGLYGGVIGWSKENQADSTVCIRCCHVEGSTVHCYTGAGIVAGSDWQVEWEELEAKLSLYEGIFL